MNSLIRLSETGDGDLFVKVLHQEGVLRYFPMANDFEIEDSKRLWEIFCRRGASLTAVVDGKAVGIAFLNLHPYKKLAHQCLITILVDEAFRGKGVGTKLLEELFSLAKNGFKLELLHLEVYETNPAKRLYERLGFTVYGVNKRYLKEGDLYIDKILMERTI